MLNKVILIGRLGQNPEIRKTENDKTIARLSVATDESYTDKEGNRVEVTEWHNIVVFGKLAEIVGEYFSKGRLVYVIGKLRTRQWEDKNGNRRWTTEIVANELRLLDKKRDENKNEAEAEPNIDEDDIPF